MEIFFCLILVGRVDQRRQNLSIGLALKLITAITENLFEILVVLDDAVMDQVDITNVMRMSVSLTRYTMPCPPSMSDADRVGFFVFRRDARGRVDALLTDVDEVGTRLPNNR